MNTNKISLLILFILIQFPITSYSQNERQYNHFLEIYKKMQEIDDIEFRVSEILGYFKFLPPTFRTLDDAESLYGLNGVKLSIGDITLENIGIDKSIIRRNIESRLNRVGIEVIPDDEYELFQSYATLSVNITAMEISRINMYASIIALELFQDIFLSRDPYLVRQSLPTWSKISLITFSGDSYNFVEESLYDQLNEFIIDFLRVNR